MERVKVCSESGEVGQAREVGRVDYQGRICD